MEAGKFGLTQINGNGILLNGIPFDGIPFEGISFPFLFADRTYQIPQAM